MKCLNCGGETGGKAVCPYCKMPIKTASKIREENDKTLQERFIQIDEAYGLNVDYVSMTPKRMEEFFVEISNKFEEDRKRQRFTEEQLEKILQHLDDVDETLQSKLPLRDGATFLPTKLKLFAPSQAILSLINDYDPPYFVAAAFQLRACCERQLNVMYNDKVDDIAEQYKQERNKAFDARKNDPSIKIPPFPYVRIFSEYTKLSTVSNDVWKLYKRRKILHLFVHASDKNDKELEEYLKKTSKSKQEFIVDTLNLFTKYNLIGNKVQ